METKKEFLEKYQVMTVAYDVPTVMFYLVAVPKGMTEDEVDDLFHYEDLSNLKHRSASTDGPFYAYCGPNGIFDWEFAEIANLDDIKRDERLKKLEGEANLKYSPAPKIRLAGGD